MDDADEQFDLAPYGLLRKELLKSGIHCGINSRHQITISTQTGPIWPDRGCSFWVTCAPGSWYVFPWYHAGYSLPDEGRLAEFCRVCIQKFAEAVSEFPEEIVDEFELRQLSEGESEDVLRAMATAR